MQPRQRAALVMAAIAIASAIAGAAIDRTLLVRGHPRGARTRAASAAADARRRAEMLDRMNKDLSLSAAQRAAIDSVFVRTDSAVRLLRQESQPRVQRVLEQSRADIAARLDSAQREKFLTISARRDSMRRAGRP